MSTARARCGQQLVEPSLVLNTLLLGTGFPRLVAPVRPASQPASQSVSQTGVQSVNPGVFFFWQLLVLLIVLGSDSPGKAASPPFFLAAPVQFIQFNGSAWRFCACFFNAPLVVVSVLWVEGGRMLLVRTMFSMRWDLAPVAQWCPFACFWGRVPH